MCITTRVNKKASPIRYLKGLVFNYKMLRLHAKCVRIACVQMNRVQTSTQARIENLRPNKHVQYSNIFSNKHVVIELKKYQKRVHHINIASAYEYMCLFRRN